MKSSKNIINLLIVLVALLLINILGQYFYFQYDFTEDKRYSITKPTKELLEEQEDVIFVKILLEGDFPAGFKRLQRSASELLEQFKTFTPYIEYGFEDPMEGSIEDVNERLQVLKEDGIYPIPLNVEEKDAETRRHIFPYAVFNFGTRKFVVNLLEPKKQGIPDEIWMNNNINLLEYKFANAIQKLQVEEKPTILFTTGKGELAEQQRARLETKLAQFYQVGTIDLDSVVNINKNIDLLIVAKPTQSFNNKNQFIIDQYLMNGGNILWMIDKANVDLDSIAKQRFYTPEVYPLNLDDLWFKYGIRIQPNLVQDMECSRIPQVVGMQGDKPQIEKFNWFYHPLVTPGTGHPIIENLDLINLDSPSTIDTIRTSTAVRKTILLTSSPYSRYQLLPARITFDILRYQPDVSRFDKGNQPLAVLVEGEFESFFKNKLTAATTEMLDQIGTSFLERSIEPGKMIFVSDGDIAKNLFDGHRISPIGYNKWEEYTFGGNEDFITNSIEYLINDHGVLTARNKNIKLRLLDRIKADEERTKWQVINFGVPILFILLFGLVFNYLRRRKYNK